ncbi:LysR family transcriptional regulator [Solitalea canadensis]|uniref:Transcriptional regulator n=1 Tax=Solitalea canadensis (strain ATCC 29591 / DSM 3403 / JCM 21819 / LMG 8368 / NBRC 15130 / NCIMB 12057 / USAM 9D) TaxID=929556 RepID=H8KPY1_SOLCM|nr:LysR family transcriptional regulator [Solitalea canadensis]AFD06090.1 transcriptional regulator [Solitalea canadensis DSM 3403]
MISIANQIELRHLNYFKVLAEELHYRKASEILFISQSALSQQIKQLEQILKTSLFDRTNKRVALTDAGVLFYSDVVQVINKVDAAVTRLKLWKDGNTGQIGIGFVASAMESILPGLIKRFHKDCPNIKFQLDELNNREQIIALQNESIDLGFMRSNYVAPELQIKCVFKETFSLVLPNSHPLTKETFKHVGQLKDEPFILFPNDQSHLYYQQIINICADQGFTPKIAHRSIHAPTIFRLVENGMGLSIIPTSLATGGNPNIKFIELTNVPQQTELYAVWKKGNNNPALPYLLEMLDDKLK